MSPHPDGGAVAERRCRSHGAPAARRPPSQPGHVRGALAHLELGAGEVLADRLGAAAQVCGQEGLGDGIEGDAVLRHRKAVSLLGVEHIRDRQGLGAHGGDDLVGLGLLHARIVGALADQQRLGYGARGMQRRALLQQLAPRLGARIADPPGQVLEERRPVGRDGRQQRLQIGRADDVDAAAEHVRREGQARQRGVAAVGAAHDGDAGRIGDALLHRPGDGVEQVVVHLAAPFEVAGVDERLAEAGRAAEVDGQHGPAAVGQPLVLRVEAVLVARPGSAVHQQHHGQRRLGTTPGAGRQRQVRHQLQPVARADDLGMHGQRAGRPSAPAGWRTAR